MILMKKLPRSRGQSLVETTLVLPIIIMVLLFSIDPFLFAVNLALGKYYTFQAAREASIYMADGTHTCQQMANRVVGAGPPFLMVDTGGWSMTVTPCPNDTGWTTPTGQFVTATIIFHQKRVFWISPTGTVISQDIFQ